ncbi:hypothetical protein ACFWBN_09155 [Streptomyces sp. NPDC059989]|uniref:hypothetical protein n=1 Tax=Streptomyces sp. NPDC059989 TaxID=3347026 RepID=UPI00367ABF62
MDPGIIGQAAGLFAVTNIDDILILARCSSPREPGTAAPPAASCSASTWGSPRSWP